MIKIRKSFPKNPGELTKEDILALRELSKHMDHLIHELKDFRSHPSRYQEVREAFEKIFEDSKSENELEKYLASFILSELQNFQLKVRNKHNKHYTALSFLQEFIKGDISDEKLIQEGFIGLSSPTGLVILRGCKPDLIFEQYRLQE